MFVVMKEHITSATVWLINIFLKGLDSSEAIEFRGISDCTSGFGYRDYRILVSRIISLLILK